MQTPLRAILARMVLAGSIFASCIPSSAAEPIGDARNEILQRRGSVRVFLAAGVEGQTIQIAGGHRVIVDGEKAGEHPFAATYTISAGPGGVTITAPVARYGPARTITLDNTGAKSAAEMEYQRRSYRGKLTVESTAAGTRLLNELGIEDWLRGVLAAEIAGASLEAFKAQAIAARSEALVKLSRGIHRKDGYDLCADVHCMAYKGAGGENQASNRAIDETFGKVLVDGDRVLDAVFHSYCGGVTASIESVWGGRANPSLVSLADRPQSREFLRLEMESAAIRFITSSRDDFYCNPARPGFGAYANKYFRWDKSYKAADLFKRCGIGVVTNIEVLGRTQDGRVTGLRVTGLQGTKQLTKHSEIREMFDLPSTLFVLSMDRSQRGVDSVVFRGTGHGHGVGMCQQGASVMAESGSSAEEILRHYFPAAEVKLLYRP